MRLLAAVLDLLALTVLAIPLLLALSGGEPIGGRGASGAGRLLVDWALPSALILGFWWWRGATPGKMAVGARIVDAASGGRPRPLQLLVRYLGYFLSALPLGLGFLWIAFDPRKQGWHDKLARTVVRRVPR